MISLRYKGKPDRGANKIADDLIELCFCRFVAVGFPMDGKECPVHGTKSYGCDECICTNYRPNKVKTAPVHWPRCICGHIAQEHNKVF